LTTIDLTKDSDLNKVFTEFKKSFKLIPKSSRVVESSRKGYHIERYTFDNNKNKYYEIRINSEQKSDNTDTPANFKAINSKISLVDSKNVEQIDMFIKFALAIVLYGFESDKVTIDKEIIIKKDYITYIQKNLPKLKKYNFKNNIFLKK